MEPRAPLGSNPSAHPPSEVSSENTNNNNIGITINSVTTDNNISTTAIGLGNGDIVTAAGVNQQRVCAHTHHILALQKTKYSQLTKFIA